MVDTDRNHVEIVVCISDWRKTSINEWTRSWGIFDGRFEKVMKFTTKRWTRDESISYVACDYDSKTGRNRLNENMIWLLRKTGSQIHLFRDRVQLVFRNLRRRCNETWNELREICFPYRHRKTLRTEIDRQNTLVSLLIKYIIIRDPHSNTISR